MVNAISPGVAPKMDAWSSPTARPTQMSPTASAAGASISPTEVLTRWSAAKLGLTDAAFSKANSQGSLRIGSDDTGALRVADGPGLITAKGSVVPMTPDGVPDLLAMMNAGAEIIGAATSGGEPVVANQSQFGLKAYWAFQVDFHDGKGPQWVKGGTADPGPDTSEATRAKVVADLIDTVSRLPNSLVEFMSQMERREGTLYDDNKPPVGRIDLMA